MLERLLFLLVAALGVLTADLHGAGLPQEPDGLQSGKYHLRTEAIGKEGKEQADAMVDTKLVDVTVDGNNIAFSLQHREKLARVPPGSEALYESKFHDVEVVCGKITPTGVVKVATTILEFTPEREDLVLRTIYFAGKVNDSGAEGTMIAFDDSGEILGRGKWTLERAK